MADWIIISAVVFGYLAVVLLIGVAGRQKDAAISLDAYLAGSRGLGLGLLFFIIGAEFYSSVTFLGAPGWAYSRGVPALFMMVSFSFALLPWWWMGVYTARLGRRYGFLTQSDLLGARYQSSFLSVLTAAIGVVALLPYFVVQIVGSGYLFTAATGGKIPFWLSAFLVYIIVLIYTFVGGLRAIAWTNVIQGFILLIAAWIIGLVIPYRFYGGVDEMFMRLAAEAPEYLTIPGHQGAMPWAAYSSSIIVIILGMTMWPHLFNRAYSAATDHTLKRTVVMFPLYSLLIVPILFVGFAGVLMFENLEKPDQVMIKLIEMAGFSPWFVGVVISGALAASMSTGANVLHTIASILVKDFLLKLRTMPQEGRKQVKLTRWVVVIVFGLSYYLALHPPQSILSLVLVAYGILVQLFPGVVAAFFWTKVSKQGVITGLTVGIGISVYYTFLANPVFGIHAGLLGLIANLVLVITVSLITRPPDENYVKEFLVVARTQ